MRVNGGHRAAVFYDRKPSLSKTQKSRTFTKESARDEAVYSPTRRIVGQMHEIRSHEYSCHSS
ncbi:hypothetical protein C1881_10005 [Slackia isoflavoniconvertens]|uniref:Uncharacterized protein n=1 Tax=Slackia isoflavoniconvertens TaxID=572010 RepID=A0A369LAA4_9ACTN|nr:hypothetical protein C1881_10005 [Slackia isoflavoniconvertens]